MVKYTNNTNAELNGFLNMRYIPPPSTNLAERIIDASLLHKKQGRKGFELWARSFWDAFLLPKPAYVMAAFFIIGISFGLYSEVANALQIDAESLSALVYTAEDVVAEGDWL
jgi:hypothetical protein